MQQDTKYRITYFSAEPSIGREVTVKTFLLLTIAIFLILPKAGQSEDSRGLKATEERRTALVIGNADYPIAPLGNPVNDAQDMAEQLRASNFEVNLLTNVDRKQMVLAIRKFGKDIKKGGAGLFYYAGHGIQINGENFMIPIDAEPEEEHEVPLESVGVQRILGYMDSADNALNIVILDACRNNPFSRSFRSSTKGLAQMDAPSGTMIAYATAPGSVAADGTGRNGLYTEKLLEQISVPGLEVGQMFRQVRAGVSVETNGKQIPWESTSLTGDFYFTPFDDSPVTGESVLFSASASQLSVKTDAVAEKETWEFVRDSNSLGELKEFLRIFPAGNYALLAKLKISRLEKKQNPVSSKQIVTLPNQQNIKRLKNFVRVEPGSFSMGNNSAQSNIWSGAVQKNRPPRSELPLHRVKISRPFYISDHEVTVGEYTRFDFAAGSTRCRESECPVTNVSWTSAQTYIDWLNRTEPLEDELQYRLCKEAEWEYAARAETSTKWSCGNSRNCLDKHAWSGELVTTGSAHPVKTKEPNPWGLYDIHGNVDEWVEDRFCSYKAPMDENAQRICPEKTRAIRGGNFLIYSLVNSSLRKERDPEDSSRTLGLRLCASRE